MVLLIVSSSPETLRRLTSLGAECGFQIQQVISTDEASQVLTTNPQITLTILDSSLGEPHLRPFINHFGLASASRVRRPLILYLNPQAQLVQSQSVEWGCHQFLPEPLAKESFLALVHQACAWMNKRILVLAENEELVTSLSDLFSQDFCATAHVRSVGEVAPAISQAAFHVLIAEEHLFGRNPREVLGALRVQPQRIPLVLLTEYGQARSNWQGGVDLVLTKPVNLMVLRDRVRELLAIYRTPVA